MKGDQLPLHVLLFPCLAFDHGASSSVQLSNWLSHNGINITFLSPTSFISNVRSLLHPNIRLVSYHLPPVAGIPAGVEPTVGDLPLLVSLLEAVESCKQQITDQLSQLSPQVVIFDFIHHWLPPLADSLGIKAVFFYTGSAGSAASCLRTIRRLRAIKLMLAVDRLLPSSLLAAFSGLKRCDVRDMLHFFKSHRGVAFSFYQRLAATITLSSAVALKSATEIERKTIKYLSSRCPKRLLLTGTLVSKAPHEGLEPRWDWEEWLSKYPAGSVVFCSVGSEVGLPDEQFTEIVAGLEMSGLPFLLIMDLPPTSKAKVVVEERLGGKGMVCKGWKQKQQQQHILRHSSVGVYVGHGELSSMLEAVAGGCQVVVLPTKGDVASDAKVMVGELKAGVAVKVRRSCGGGRLTREAVCRAVGLLMSEDSDRTKRVRANNAKLRELLLNDSSQQHHIQKFMAKLRGLMVS
ncbi:anthocyanidin-3-O-glucoside rhamnosyltransferase-like [Nymphaea colorata]|uniref:Glycosyltransferase n=1 Tax=Nymphaea colorata TaxID=210225 RepID=A0A5K1BFG0_9MAGN|nr:anthocyanidin-3-O-glucoside rhamnosyltransferase-like [Nymphaea colorata]